MILSCIIPHAMKKYAGSCRTIVFNDIKNFFSQLYNKKSKWDQIIFIAALHENSSLNYRYNDTLDIFPKFVISKTKIKNYTYDWVEDEIKNCFPDVKITIIYPRLDNNIDTNLNIPNNKNILFIGTTDLIHNTSYKYSSEDKIFLEGEFIDYICQLDEDNLIKFYKNYPNICCGFFSIRYIIYIVKNFCKQEIIEKDKYRKLLMESKRDKTPPNGQVLDYYDSYQEENRDGKKYDTRHKKDDYFVSYVGIVFQNLKDNNLFNIIDTELILSGIKNLLEDYLDNSNLKDYTNNLELKNYINEPKKYFNINNYIPKFNNIYKIDNGIFISTKDQDDNINSCIGVYEDDNQNRKTADMILECIPKMILDSKNRWNNPIYKDKFKVIFDILDKKINWKKVDKWKFSDMYKSYGIYICNKKDNAIFLPSVWRENPNWSPNKILNELSKKAGFLQDTKYDIYVLKVWEFF